MTFDYMHSARPRFVTRLIEWRIPSRLQAPALALLCAVICVAGAWTIEHRRFAGALSMESEYQRRYDRIHVQVVRADLYYQRICELVALDRQVRGIVASGDADARRLTEIANAIPPHVWLTGIAWDGSDVVLEGGAKTLSALSGVFHTLARGITVTSPTLVRAQRDARPGADTSTTYTLRLQSTGS
ncbi:MAG TPA: PilN domain-containing protein [Candidatus Baltobacteraceae bacterium]|jgi:hypothetical protein|nr:PilN domain-containing protein [Candidatus Baltobacteraceae bacterium]